VKVDEMMMSSRLGRGRALALAVIFTWQAGLAQAQTKVTAPGNKFKPAEDVELGQKAAQQVRRQLPVLRDEPVDSFVDEIGERLVEAVPAEYRHPEFRYSFEVVNARDINAFALPGGPMFINRGMIAAAKTEGEVASVMAHELSHVVLRHGTAQASKAQKYQFGELAGQVLGAIVGGTAGAVIAQGSQFGLGAAFLRFSRDYERQADLLGSQIMARAGYDPRDMASMFRTIAKQGGSRGPEWLSSHPNPGNRSEAIEREAQLLQVEGPVRGRGDLRAVQARLTQMPRARSTEEITKNARTEGRGAGEEGATGTSGVVTGNVEPPSSNFRTYRVGDDFEVSVPENWRQEGSGNSVRFAPEGATGSLGGQEVFTHGVEFGVAGNDTSNLQEATTALVEALSRTNPELRQQGRAQRVNFGGREGIRIVLRNVSEATRQQEAVVLNTTLLDEGNLFYSIGVAPANQISAYQRTLQQVNGSVRFR
jgi:Zn-dependent protease with chaperone function